MTTFRIAIATVTAAAALAATAESAAAQSLILQQQSARHRTRITGHSGSEARVGFANALMHGIRWSERDDDPCYFDVSGIGIKGGEPFKSRRSYDGCEIKSASLKQVYFVPPKPDFRFIRGIQVCTSKSQKVKGIRAWALRLDAETGEQSDDGATPIAAQRDNCSAWHDKRMCPSGQLATGLVLQRDKYNDVVGLKLECSTVRMSTPMTRPQ